MSADFQRRMEEAQKDFNEKLELAEQRNKDNHGSLKDEKD